MYELWNINCITIKVLNIYYGKIEVVSFITTTGRKLIIVVKVDVNVKKWGRGRVSKVWINNSQNIIYILESELKGFSFCNVLSLIRFGINSVLEEPRKRSTRRGVHFVSIRMPKTYWKMCHPNSTNILSIWNSNILIISFSVQYILFFVSCWKNEW
jgi:hypothetical protein